MIKEFFCAILLLLIIIILAGILSKAVAVEMPRLDRSGTYQFVRYQFDSTTLKMIEHTVVGTGTFKDCSSFVEKQGPMVFTNGTEILYGCEKFEGPSTASS